MTPIGSLPCSSPLSPTRRDTSKRPWPISQKAAITSKLSQRKIYEWALVSAANAQEAGCRTRSDRDHLWLRLIESQGSRSCKHLPIQVTKASKKDRRVPWYKLKCSWARKWMRLARNVVQKRINEQGLRSSSRASRKWRRRRNSRRKRIKKPRLMRLKKCHLS